MNLELVSNAQSPCMTCGSRDWSMATANAEYCNLCRPELIERVLDSHPNCSRYKLGAATQEKPEPGKTPAPDTMDLYLLEREPVGNIYGLACRIRDARHAGEMRSILDRLFAGVASPPPEGLVAVLSAEMAAWENLKKVIDGDLPGLKNLQERMAQQDAQSTIWVPGSAPEA